MSHSSQHLSNSEWHLEIRYSPNSTPDQMYWGDVADKLSLFKLIYQKRQLHWPTRVDGKKDAKQTYTSKPPPGQTCSFQLRLCLNPGNCRYLPPWAGNISHNHKKQGAEEMRRRMVTLSQQHQYEASVFHVAGRLDRQVEFWMSCTGICFPRQE